MTTKFLKFLCIPFLSISLLTGCSFIDETDLPPEVQELPEFQEMPDFPSAGDVQDTQTLTEDLKTLPTVENAKYEFGVSGFEPTIDFQIHTSKDTLNTQEIKEILSVIDRHKELDYSTGTISFVPHGNYPNYIIVEESCMEIFENNFKCELNNTMKFNKSDLHVFINK